MNTRNTLRLAGNSVHKPVFFLGLLLLIFATTGCASKTVDRSFDDLSAAVDRLARTVAPPDEPRDCNGTPPNSLTLYVRFNGSCPKEIVPADNGCVDQKSKNVACVCRNNVGSAENKLEVCGRGRWRCAPGLSTVL